MLRRTIFNYSKRINPIQVKTITTGWRKPIGKDTEIKIYNCVARTLVPVILRNNEISTWYTCGPTVYDSPHIGHASCYVKLDIIQRILRNYFNINLITAMNITDIDDKIIKRSIEESIDWKDLARKYEDEFWSDLKLLGVIEPDLKLRVTDHIPLIIKFIKQILNKDKAYKSVDNSAYFKVDSYPQYGKLQRLNLEKTKHETKQFVEDFALWKSKKQDEPSWDSPWGPGRPGWHIECSALASKLFGNVIDFHAGGLDLKFPHHENEEAQSCTYHNTEQWVNYWIHTGHLNIKGDRDKMSKSLKNTINISELLKNYTSDEFRMACILSNYRNSMEYADDMMLTAKTTLDKFLSFNSDCIAYIDGKKPETSFESESIFQKLNEVMHLIDNDLKNDFDTARSISHLLDLVGNVSKAINNTKNIDELYTSSNKQSIVASNRFVNKMLHIYGIESVDFKLITRNENSSSAIENIIDELISVRKHLRLYGTSTKNKEFFKLCDKIRENLQKNGIEIKDHGSETSWSFVKK